MKLLPRVVLPAMTFLVLAPQAALAHLVNSGLGPFYDGALHLAISPDDLLGLISIALLAGLCGTRASRLTVFVLPFSWFAAGLAGLTLPVTINLPWLSILSFLVMGVMVAANPKLHPITVATLAGIFGVIHGLFNGSALAAIGAGPMALAGIGATLFVIALLVSAAVVSLRATWTRIAVRVAGSWVAAVGMLMFGWLVKGTA